jgi:hypothetical protein
VKLERACGNPECGNLFEPRRWDAVYCCGPCQDRMRRIAASKPFTAEMAAELYADAKAGRIAAWQEIS